MSKRKPISQADQAEVLYLSRRRCCLCFGLLRDTGIKAGQIAHLDHNRSNNNLDNLVFLCLSHHGEYDATSRQTKGLLPAEVRRHRKDLHEAVGGWVEEPTTFTPVSSSLPPGVEGRYVRQGKYDLAEIEVKRLPGGNLHVVGIALWGTDSRGGPNIGQLDFEAPISASNGTTHTEPTSSGDYKLDIQFRDGLADAREEYQIGMFGMNVSFEGTYRKVAPATFAPPHFHPPRGDGPDAIPTRCSRCGNRALYGSKCEHCGYNSDDF